MSWDPNKVWTRPSITRMSGAEWRARLSEKRQLLADLARWAEHPNQRDVSELRDSYSRAIDTYERALASRESASTRS